MDINLHIDNSEDISYIEKIEKTKLNSTLQMAISIGLKSIQMSEVNMDCHSYIDPIKKIVQDKTEENTDYLLNISDKLDDLLHIKTNSSRKGKLSEDICRNLLIKNYPSWDIIDVSQLGYEGDCRIYGTPIGQILYEFKSYDQNVNRDQINKFVRDLEHTNINYGIFVSNTSGIVGKKNIEWEMIDNKLIVFVSNMGLDGYGCILGTELLVTLADLDILNKDKNWLLYQNYDLEELTQKISSSVDMLRNNIELYVKHKELISDQRIKINQSIDQLEKSSFNCLLELNHTLDTIISTIKNVRCSKELVNDIFNKDEFMKRINNERNKVFIEKFIKLCTNFSLRNSNEGLIVFEKDKRICALKLLKSKIEILFPIKDEIINLNYKYEKIRGKDIVIDLKDDYHIWKILEIKLNI